MAEKIRSENLVLAAANAYQQKFYLNPEFRLLPPDIKQEIKLICVRFVEEVGGILELSFSQSGNLCLITHVAEDDLLFDEIGAELLIKEYQREKEDLFAQLELYYLSTMKS